jgi:MFS family permease
MWVSQSRATVGGSVLYGGAACEAGRTHQTSTSTSTSIMAAQSKPAAAGRKQMRALAVASGGFYLTFAAWGLMENLISTYYQRLGYYSMSLVYFGIGPGALVAPAVIAKYGARRSMALACSTYTLYAIAHNLMEFGIGTAGQLLLPAGALVGFTCSTLWTSLGIYTKNLSRAYDVELGKDSETDGSLGFVRGI